MSKRPDHVWVREAGDRFAFGYRDGVAQIGGVSLETLAEAVGTPAYVYGLDHIATRYRRLADAVGGRPTSICYAVKANGSLAVLKHLASLGAGADIVSGGELARALAAGIPGDKIVFSGVGKTDDEIDAALQAGVRSINVESRFELAQVSARAQAHGKPAPVSLRVNPDVDPKTHPYLATGMQTAKFGIAMGDALELALVAAKDSHLTLVGLACHIGSQIIDAKPFLDSVDRIRGLMDALAKQGVSLAHLDLGGGFGIAYEGDDAMLDLEAWGKAVVDATSDLDVELVIEPGRFLVAQAGVLLTRVIGNKRGETRAFMVVDAAMNDLLRPALYGAYHAIVPVRDSGSNDAQVVDVVGPICESGDFLAQQRPMAEAEAGDLLAVLSAGAYAMSMASNYNTRPLPPEVVVSDGRWAVTRKRQTVEELLAAEADPDWQS